MVPDDRLLRDVERARRVIDDATRRFHRDVAPAIEDARRVLWELSRYRLEPLPEPPVALNASAARVPERKQKMGWLLEEAKFIVRTLVVDVLKAMWRGDLPPM